MTIRVGHQGDAEAMARIYVRAARDAWGHIYGAESLAVLEAPFESFRHRLRSTDPHHRVLVVEESGGCVAFAVIRATEDDDAESDRVGELDMFYSDPAVWGRGFGRRLLAFVVEEFRQHGFVGATLWTAEENRRPRRIYEAGGWRLDGAVRERVWHGTSFREVRYRIAL